MNKILEYIGLKQLEAKTYLALLELGESQTGEICKKSNIASSNIYSILNELIKKGLVSFKVENNIKKFIASRPESLKELLKKKQKDLIEQEKELNKTIFMLKQIAKPKKESTFKYFEGISGIKSLWYELNQSMNSKNIVKVYTADPKGYENLIGFYTEHHKLREKNNIKEEMIFPNTDKSLAKKRNNKVTKIKFADLKNKAEWGVVEDKVYILYSISKQPKGFLIQDEIIAETFKQVFDQVWSNAQSN